MDNIKNKKSELAKQDQPIYIMSQPMDSDGEIDLRDLLNAIFKKKIFLLVWCFIITFITLIIAYSSQKSYIAKATFYPPTASSMSDFNNKIYSITKDEVYSCLITNIKSNKIQQDTFEQLNKNSKDLSKNAFKSFSKSISLKQGTKNQKTLITTETTLSVSNKEPKKAIEATNLLLKNSITATNKKILSLRNHLITEKIKIITQTINILREYAQKERLDTISQLETKDQLQINEINNKIKLLKNNSEQNRKDSIVRLEEAYKIAEALGINDPLEHKLSTISKAATNIKSNITTDISVEKSDLYAIGTDALEAKIEALKTRKNMLPFISGLLQLKTQLIKIQNNEVIAQLKARTNDDPFIPELRSLEKDISVLDLLKDKSMGEFTPLSNELLAYDVRSGKPRKLYILLAGMLVALISGIGIVLTQHFLKQ